MLNKWIFQVFSVLSLILIQEIQALGVKYTKPQNEAAKIGEDVMLRCQCLKDIPIYWKKDEEFLQDITNLSYEIVSSDHDKCNQDLKILHVNKTSAGRYTCAKMLLKTSENYVANLIVYGNDLKCDTKNLYTNQTILQQAYVQWNDEIIINCSFTFYAHQSCRAIPLWIDNITNKTLSDSGSKIYVGSENKLIWLSFPGSAVFERETNFNLSIAFNCSVPRTNLDEEQYADNIPFIKTKFTSPVFSFLSKSNKENGAEHSSNSSQAISETSNDNQNLKILVAIVPTYLTVMVLALVLYKRKENKSTGAFSGTVAETSTPPSNIGEYELTNEGYISPSYYTEIESKEYTNIQLADEKHSPAYEEIEEDKLRFNLISRAVDESFSDHEDIDAIHSA